MTAGAREIPKADGTQCVCKPGTFSRLKYGEFECNGGKHVKSATLILPDLETDPPCAHTGMRVLRYYRWLIPIYHAHSTYIRNSHIHSCIYHGCGRCAKNIAFEIGMAYPRAVCFAWTARLGWAPWCLIRKVPLILNALLCSLLHLKCARNRDRSRDSNAECTLIRPYHGFGILATASIGPVRDQPSKPTKQRLRP